MLKLAQWYTPTRLYNHHFFLLKNADTSFLLFSIVDHKYCSKDTFLHFRHGIIIWIMLNFPYNDY